MIKQLTFVLFILIIANGSVAAAPYDNISNNELIELQKNNVPIFDIRLPEEWKKTGIIEGSKPLTFFQKDGSVNPQFMDQFSAEIAKDDPFVLICHSGSRTAAVANYLGSQGGYSRVYNVKRGMVGWLRAKKPVEKYTGR